MKDILYACLQELAKQHNLKMAEVDDIIDSLAQKLLEKGVLPPTEADPMQKADEWSSWEGYENNEIFVAHNSFRAGWNARGQHL